MAAQPNFWGTMMARDSAASSRIPPRRATMPERQGYRQSRPFEENREIASVGLLPVRAEIPESDPLAVILSAIDRLMAPEEDSGDPPATEHAYRNTRAVLESTYGLLLARKGPPTLGLPLPLVTTDERGGIRLSWQSRDRHVRTNFAAAEGLRSYLYFESPAEHDVQALQPYTLSDKLSWMLNA